LVAIVSVDPLMLAPEMMAPPKTSMSSPIVSPEIVPLKFKGSSSVSVAAPSMNLTVCPAATGLANSSSERSPIENEPVPDTAAPIKAELFGRTLTVPVAELLKVKAPPNEAKKLVTEEALIAYLGLKAQSQANGFAGLPETAIWTTNSYKYSRIVE